MSRVDVFGRRRSGLCSAVLNCGGDTETEVDGSSLNLITLEAQGEGVTRHTGAEQPRTHKARGEARRGDHWSDAERGGEWKPDVGYETEGASGKKELEA